MAKQRPQDDAPEMVAATASVAPAPTFTPDEHAARLGNMVTGSKIGALPPPVCHCWQHKAADALHGWASHAHHAGAPIQLTEAAYAAALAAAEAHPYTPHPAALSPHCRKYRG